MILATMRFKRFIEVSKIVFKMDFLKSKALKNVNIIQAI